MKPPKTKALAALIPVVLAGAMQAGNTLAQQPATPQSPAPKVEKIEVTGSSIKRVDAETSVPITVISAEQIARSGAVSIQELLQDMAISQGSSLNDLSSGLGFSPGSATVALRGLGSSATLTLLNGRRISPAAFNDPNVGNTVLTNLNAIPASAIERIEVLRDGASAIYGSDAIAGVVNIILKKEYQGAAVSGSLSQSPKNEFRIKQASVSFGKGDLSKDRYNIFGTYERYERDPSLLRADEHVSPLWGHPTVAGLGRGTVLSSLSYPGNYYREAVRGSGIFGTFAGIVPGCPSNLQIGGLCRYDQWGDLETVGKSTRDTGFLRGTYEFSPNVSGFIEASLSKTENRYLGAPISSNPQTATFWRTSTGELRRFQLVLPVGHRENPFAFPIGLRYRWVDLGRSVTVSETQDSRFLAGLRGNQGAWDWESSFMYNKSKAETVAGRALLFPNVLDAINDGSYNFTTGTNSQAVIDRISTFYTTGGESEAQILDVKATREWGSLAGGPIGVAVGAEYRRDSMLVTPDPQLVAGNIVGLGASFADATRNTFSAYAEVVLPITKTLEATLAARHDRYSDFGSTTNPKLGIKWRPIGNLVLRGSYSTGFRAPSLAQTNPSAVRSFQTVNDPIRCPVTGTNEDCGVIAAVAAQIVFNPDLQPETSSSRTLGLIWDIARDTSLTLDYFDIRREDEIDRFSSNFQVNALFNGDQRFAGTVFRDPNPLTWIPGVPNSGPVQGVDRKWLNLGATQVTGLDLEFTNRTKMGGGNLTTSLTATRNIAARQAREKGQPMINYIGGVNTVVTGNGLPRTRANLSLNWATGPWNFGWRVNYISGWNNSSPTLTCAQWNGATAATLLPEVCKVKPFTTMDLNAAYTGIRNLTLRAVIRNITDVSPPFDYSGGNVTLGYNTSFHNSLGIYPSISATYTFK